MRGVGSFISKPIDSIRKSRVKKAFNDLLSEDIRKTPKAMRIIRKSKHSLSLLASVNLLKHSYPEVRTEAEELIREKKPYMDSDKKLKDKVYDKLAALLVSDDYYIREAAVGALGKIDDPDYAVSCIKRQLKFEKDMSVITRVIDVLGRYAQDSKDAEDLLRKMLKSSKFENYREDVRRALLNEAL